MSEPSPRTEPQPRLEPQPRADRAVPEKPTLDGIETRWSEVWQREQTFRFGGDRSRDDVFAIDTPPPTVSGSLHVGHVFSYTHTDLIARFQRMSGKDVFYPMGWDDNGVPTERRVENYFGVLCDPTLPYDEGFEPPPEPPKQRRDFQRISRRNFIELCLRLTETDETAFEELWRHLGLSVDLGAHLHDDRRELATRQPARVPAQLRARRGLLDRRSVPVGRGLPDGGQPGRARRPRTARRVPRSAVQRPDDLDHAAGARGVVRRPRRAP